jgi:plastocyanin
MPRVLAVLILTVIPAFSAEDAKKGKKPGLDLRATPRMAFSPAEVLFTAELKGGDDVEELYCPEVEWEWGDGGKSVTEADCDPWTEGAAIERRFTANHVFQRAGMYKVKVTLRKTGRDMMTQTLMLTIRAGLGDTSPDPGP